MFPSTDNSVDDGVIGYTDTDWSGDSEDRKSTYGYIFMLGKAPIYWCSKKQNVVVLSSWEAEYISAAFSASQALRLGMLLEELKKSGGAMKLRIVNKAAIDFTKHPIAQERRKHIETYLEYYRTEDQLVNVLTKAVKIR